MRFELTAVGGPEILHTAESMRDLLVGMKPNLPHIPSYWDIALIDANRLYPELDGKNFEIVSPLGELEDMSDTPFQGSTSTNVVEGVLYTAFVFSKLEYVLNSMQIEDFISNYLACVSCALSEEFGQFKKLVRKNPLRDFYRSIFFVKYAEDRNVDPMVQKIMWRKKLKDEVKTMNSLIDELESASGERKGEIKEILWMELLLLPVMYSHLRFGEKIESVENLLSLYTPKSIIGEGNVLTPDMLDTRNVKKNKKVIRKMSSSYLWELRKRKSELEEGVKLILNE